MDPARLPRPAAVPRPRRSWVVPAVLVAVAAFVVLFDFNWLRGPLEDRLAAASGRRVGIGHLSVEPGWPATVVLEGVRLGNTDWSNHATMGQARTVRVRVEPWPLLRGRLVLRSLHLDAPVLLLERTAAGDANWHFGDDRKDAGKGIPVRDVHVRDGRLRMLEPDLDSDFILAVRSEDTDASGRSPLALAGSGRYRGHDFALQGRIDSPVESRGQGADYRVALKARAGSTRASLHGTLDPPLDITRFTVQLAISGEDMEHLHALLGIAAPSTPPYALDGELTRSGQVWRYRDFEGRVGDSDLAGRVTVELDGERPHLEAKLHSRELDFDDLGTTIGAAPGTGPNETASAEQRRLAAKRVASGRLFPTRPFHLERLRAMDADVTLDAANIVSPRLPVSAMTVRLQLRDGVLVLDPLGFAAAGGRIAGSVRLDARGDPIDARADLRMRDLELPRLFPDAQLASDSMGTIAGSISVTGQGNALAPMFATADGSVALLMGRGRVSNLLLEMAGLDIAEALGFLLTKDRTVPVRCAWADFSVADGIMTAESLGFDSSDTVISGEGNIDLGAERFDLTLHPRPKDSSFAALRVPLELTGSFRDPDISPKGGRLALRALAGAALYAIAPPAALLALVETGPGRNTDCGQDLDQRTAGDADH